MKKIFIFVNRPGFTLIEIVLVVALIAISGTLLATLLNPATQFKKARDAQRKADLRQIQAALELYRADQGSYPLSSATWPGIACGTSLSAGGVIYMQKIPCDPKWVGVGGWYAYRFESYDGISYHLRVCLENLSDPQKDAVNASYGAGTYCDGTTNWSYTLDSP